MERNYSKIINELTNYIYGNDVVEYYVNLLIEEYGSIISLWTDEELLSRFLNIKERDD